MNKRLFSIAIIFAIFSIIISCRKDIKTFLNDSNVSKESLENAKIFFTQQTALTVAQYQKFIAESNNHMRKNGKGVPFYKVAPIWKDALEVKAADGAEFILVPTKENKILNKDFVIRRIFIFGKKNGVINRGEIVEFVGNPNELNSNFDLIAANYNTGKVGSFTGAIMRYDLNYFPIDNQVYDKGNITGEYSHFDNLATASTSTTGTSSSTSSDGGYHCYELYWCTGYYGYPDSERCTFLGYSDSCWDFPSPPSGSDSGYGSASNIGGGGGPAGGNQISTVPAMSPEITIAPNTRPCLDSLKNLVVTASQLSIGMSSLLTRVTGNSLKAQHAVISLANATNHTVTIGEQSYPYQTITNPDGSTQVEELHGRTHPITGNITLNSVMMNEASDLAIAATLIHETMHSYFIWGANNLTGEDMMAFRDLNRYLFDSETYDPLPYNYPQLSTLQHMQMAETYVNSMAVLLKDVAFLKGITTSPDPSITFEQYCRDVFWGSLQQTSDLTPSNPTRSTNNSKKEYKNLSGSTGKKGCLPLPG